MAESEDKTLTAKQELFAQNISSGMTQREAYLRSGYTQCEPRTASIRGYGLNRLPHIKKRIGVLVAEKNAIKEGLDRARRQVVATNFDPDNLTLAWFKAEIYQNLLDARENNKTSDANRALEMLGRTMGFFKEFEKPGRPPNGATPTTAEERENANARPAINLQIVNRIIDQASHAAGADYPPPAEVTATSNGISHTTLLDSRSGPAVLSFDGLARAIEDGIFEPASEDGSD